MQPRTQVLAGVTMLAGRALRRHTSVKQCHIQCRKASQIQRTGRASFILDLEGMSDSCALFRWHRTSHTTTEPTQKPHKLRRVVRSLLSWAVRQGQKSKSAPIEPEDAHQAFVVGPLEHGWRSAQAPCSARYASAVPPYCLPVNELSLLLLDSRRLPCCLCFAQCLL